MHAYREGHASAGAATACRQEPQKRTATAATIRWQELTEAHRDSSNDGSNNPAFDPFCNQQGRRFSQSGSPAFVLFASQQQFGIKSFTVIEKSDFIGINPRKLRTVNDFAKLRRSHGAAATRHLQRPATSHPKAPQRPRTHNAARARTR